MCPYCICIFSNGAVPGLEDYVSAFTSEGAWGEEGYLVRDGLIPLAPEARRQQAEAARNMTALQF